MSSRGRSEKEGKAVVRVIFVSLILDLLAFTMPLPLFPRLIAWYLSRESSSPTSLLPRLLALSYDFRARLTHLSGGVSGSAPYRIGGEKNWDVVLLGGAMGSLFSLCQCIISPYLGTLSDRYGRKRVLLVTMLGNILSAVIWLRSTTFASFLLSRLVGGLSEGNVQLSTAIISDVSTASTRSRSLALIGIAFSICFTLGPSIGAYFASRPLPLPSGAAIATGRVGGTTEEWNLYALPAAVSLVLLLFETGYLALRLPETRNWQQLTSPSESKQDKGKGKATEKAATEESVETRLTRLRLLGRLHGLFLLLFSGAEFTLTFLTYDLFAASNAQNGRLLSYIGILSALLQARHVRPLLSRKGEMRVASFGIASCIPGLFLLALLPFSARSTDAPPWLGTMILYSAATCLAYTSATVVTSLTAAAASCCDEAGGHPALQRGKALGRYRSMGQLGRAVGPLLTCSIYWTMGPTFCYTGLGLLLSGVLALTIAPVREEKQRKLAQKTK